MILLLTLILLNVAAVVVGSVEELSAPLRSFLYRFEVFSVLVFTAEYALRVWASTTEEKFRRPIWGRFRYMLTPLALVDLLAIIPFYLPALIPLDLRYLRLLRLFRVLRVFKVARYLQAMRIMGHVLWEKKEELLITLGAGAMLLLIASSLVYGLEKEAQPDKFSSIPAAMWWAVVTLTTVGYGDIYPVTAAGKIVASIVSLIGVGLVALPAGIFASGFIQHIQKAQTVQQTCPHCGKEIQVESR
jgi:voltage-gated potassium channel